MTPREVEPCCDPNCNDPLGGAVIPGYTRPIRISLGRCGAEGYACRCCYHRIYNRFRAGKPLFDPRGATTKIIAFKSPEDRDAAYCQDKKDGMAELRAEFALSVPLLVLTPPFSLNELRDRGFSAAIVDAWLARDFDAVVGPVHEKEAGLASSWGN